MTAKALTNNVPAISGPFDANSSNSVVPSPSQMSGGFIPNIDNVAAEQQNYLHNSHTTWLWLAQTLGLLLPFNPNPTTGLSLVATPQGGLVSLTNSATFATEIYVARNAMASGYADPSIDPANWALLNLNAIATYTPPYADATGTGDALLASYPSVIYPVLQDGFQLTVGITSPNITTTPTLQVTLNGSVKTAYVIVKFINNVEYPLAPGDLQGDADFRFDAPNSKWILMNPGSGFWQPGDYKVVAGTATPIGFLACPTTPTNISRTAYAALFAAIGTTWGVGDGSTTFGMPYFPAGYALVAGIPAALTHGKVKDHTHPTLQFAGNTTGGAYPSGASSSGGNTGTPNAPEGGADNLAAGMGALICVKY